MKIILLFTTYFLAQVFASALYYFSVPHGADFAEYGYMLLGSYVLLYIILVKLNLVRKNSMPSWKTQRFKGLIPAATCMLLMALGVELLLKPFEFFSALQVQMFDSMKTNVLCILLLTIVGPLIEELVFREGILRQLVHHHHINPILAVIVSALAFGLIHFNWAQGVPAFLLGILLGGLYLLSGDIRLCVVAHVINNTMGLLYLYVPDMGKWQDQLSTPMVIGLGALLCSLSFYLLQLLLIPHENKKHRSRR